MANEFVEGIRAAVAKLDKAVETDWTQSGLPSVERVRDLAEDPSITRADITAAIETAGDDSATEATNATEEQADDTTTAPEAKDADEQTGQSVTDKTQAPDGQTNQEDAPQGDEAGGDLGEPRMSLGDFMVRGMLMAVIMRLPSPMRILADAQMLDDMTAFVGQFELQEEQHVVVEMIRSISEAKMSEIPSGQYKLRVMAAMDVVRGETSAERPGIAPADDRDAAKARLDLITGQGTAPAPGAVMKSALTGANDEQAAAHGRLFGADGVRDADE